MFTDKTGKSIQTFPLIYFTCTSTDVWTDKGRTRHALKRFTTEMLDHHSTTTILHCICLIFHLFKMAHREQT